MKILTLVVVLVYIISPVDAAPGPLDDVIVTLLRTVVMKRFQ